MQSKPKSPAHKPSRLQSLSQSWKIGWFLAVREFKKANKWTTLLIVTVMVLTFLNLIVISGVLVGLIESSVDANKVHYTSDVIVSTLIKKSYIERSTWVIERAWAEPGVEAVAARYVEGGKIEANYKSRTRLTDKVDQTAGLIAGIDPSMEDRVTDISQYMVEGKFLEDGDTDSVVIGSNLLFKYTPIESPGFQTLKDVEVGTRVRLIVGGKTKEVTVKGIIKSKVGEVDQRIFMVDRELRRMIGRDDFNVDEIAIRLKPGVDPVTVKNSLEAQGIGEYAKVQTWEEAQPKFLNDIKVTFALLGNLIGSIGLAVACITIFIIIFVNAITRRRYIGILKGIGIKKSVIEISYVIQSVVYALLGTLIGSAIVFLLLKPYIAANPINFPFSNGTLVATPMGTFIRAVILLIATMIAGYIPARIVVKQNTLDAILGR